MPCAQGSTEIARQENWGQNAGVEMHDVENISGSNAHALFATLARLPVCIYDKLVTHYRSHHI